MELERVTDEAGVLAWHEILRASFDADYESLPADPVDDIRPALDGLYDGEAVELWLGRDDRGDRDGEEDGGGDGGGAAVAAVNLRSPVYDNTNLTNLSLWVHPAHRRRGHGRRAMAAALDLVRAKRRTQVLLEVVLTDADGEPSPGARLAAEFGARPMTAEARRLLDLDALDEQRVAELDADARAASTGYSMLRWRERTPPEWVNDMAELTALMSTDPPMGELDLEPETWTAERYLEREESFVARRRKHLTVAARDDETGRLAGYTDLGIPYGPASVGYQWSTIVRKEHRGHKLGLRMKIDNLRYLAAEHPEVRKLNTWNADENPYMVSVNDVLGFRVMESWAEWQIDL